MDSFLCAGTDHAGCRPEDVRPQGWAWGERERGAVLIFASIVISKWGYRFGVPTLLLFLFTGMLFGSDGLGLEFHSHEDAQLIGMLSLSVILFSGGMDTKRRDIEPVATQGLMLSTVGVLITTVITRVSLSSHSRKHFLKSQIITQRSKRLRRVTFASKRSPEGHQEKKKQLTWR